MTDIIESLIRLATREKIDPVIRSESKPHHIALYLTKTGKVARWEMVDRPISHPWGVSRTGEQILPNLYFDNLTYVLGVEKTTKKAAKKTKVVKKNKKTAADRRKASAEAHEEMALEAPTVGSLAVAAFFAKPAPVLKDIPEGADIVFYLNGEERPICEEEELYETIAKMQRRQFTSIALPSIFDDGQKCVVDVHPKVSLVGLGFAQSMITFDSPTTHIMPSLPNAKRVKCPMDMRMLHAPMSYEAMRAYSGALDWLSSRNRIQMPATKPDNASCYVWSEGPVAHPLEVSVCKLFRGRQKDQTQQEWLAWLGEVFDDERLLTDQTPINILSLALANRNAVRGFHRISAGQLASNIRKFLDDFSYEFDGRRIRLGVLPGLVIDQGVYRKDGKISIMIAEQFFDAVLLGTPYPKQTFNLAMKRYYLAKKSQESTTLHAATVAAYLSRRDSMTTEELKRSPHFICGRLFAVFERRAYAARTKNDSPSVNRRLDAVARNPAKGIMGLMRLTRAHEEKLSRKGRYTFTSDVNVLVNMIKDAGGYPGPATIEQRGHFHLGYEHEHGERRRAIAALRVVQEAAE